MHRHDRVSPDTSEKVVHSSVVSLQQFHKLLPVGIGHRNELLDRLSIERIRRRRPRQNGRDERIHLTLKKEATKPPSMSSLQQQARFDVFVREFRTERPHEALNMKCPIELYAAPTRPYDGLPELTCPFHDRDIMVTACGRICMHRKKISISTVLAGQRPGQMTHWVNRCRLVSSNNDFDIHIAPTATI